MKKGLITLLTDNFMQVISKAKIVCEVSNHGGLDHIADVSKMVKLREVVPKLVQRLQQLGFNIDSAKIADASA